MKVWALEHVSIGWRGWWTGNALLCTAELEDAVLFVRRVDAERALLGNPLLNASPVEVTWPAPVPPLPDLRKELPDGDEPRGQSAVVHRGDGDAVNTSEP
jgi:hypothetical protein